MINVSVPPSETATAGQATSVNLGSFTQSNATGPFTVTVNWGDGSANGSFSVASAGQLPVTAHTFLNSGTITVTVTLTDSTGHSSNGSTITVDIAEPAVTPTPPSAFSAGQVITVVVNAYDLSGQIDPSFNGQVTINLVSSTGAFVPFTGASSASAINGIATFSNVEVPEAGTFSVSASTPAASGTTLKVNVTPTVGGVPGNTQPAFGKVTLPTTVVAGAAFTGRVPVVIKNTGSTILNGNFTVNVFINATNSLDGNQTIIATTRGRLKMLESKSKTINVNVRALPTSVSAGSYYILIQVVDPTKQANTTASAQPFTVAPATVILNISNGSIIPGTILIGKSGSITLTVTNTGNSAAVGPFHLTLGTSSDGLTSINGVTLATEKSRHLVLRAGKSAKFRLRFKVASTAQVGTFYPYFSISIGGATKTMVGTTQFTIG